MRIIDTGSGQDVAVGDVVEGFRIVRVSDRLLSAKALVERVETGARYWVSLTVRFLHPDFMFQRVAFLPT